MCRQTDTSQPSAATIAGAKCARSRQCATNPRPSHDSRIRQPVRVDHSRIAASRAAHRAPVGSGPKGSATIAALVSPPKAVSAPAAKAKQPTTDRKAGRPILRLAGSRVQIWPIVLELSILWMQNIASYNRLRAGARGRTLRARERARGGQCLGLRYHCRRHR